ncbi:unnamed protein product [Oncorhynchus mykiss]|uniref:Uncharacterized protein n=1 Tax=Oncorhynchus mykiss TaxID=8022 RepID=A0A060X4M6_ONCMY|nr:unnamed protein product [Oncorhynchus mykiss]
MKNTLFLSQAFFGRMAVGKPWGVNTYFAARFRQLWLVKPPLMTKQHNSKHLKHTHPQRSVGYGFSSNYSHCSSCCRYDSDSWAPPLPVQTYLHQGLDDDMEEERVPTPPLRGVASSPAAAPYSQPSSSSLSSTHHEEMQSMLQAHLDELTRAYQYQVAKQTWHMKGSQHPPMAPVPPMGYVSSTLGSDLGNNIPCEEEEEDKAYGVSHQLCGFDYTASCSMDNHEGSGKGYSQRGRPVSSGSTESSALGTQSLGHQRATHTGRKPRAETVGTQRDSPTDVASPTPEPVHSVGARLHGSWASGGSDPPEECMVSTLERQHMASWSGRSSNMATLGRTRHRAAAGAGTDHPHNIHPPPNSTEHSYGERFKQYEHIRIFLEESVCGWLMDRFFLSITILRSEEDKEKNFGCRS